LVLGSSVVMVVVMMVVMDRRGKGRSREKHHQAEKESLFHASMVTQPEIDGTLKSNEESGKKHLT
jgi:hypothetical protein